MNDFLVKMYLDNSIKYIDLHELLIKLLKNPYFTKYYKKKPKNINEIKNMVLNVNNYLQKNHKK